MLGAARVGEGGRKMVGAFGGGAAGVYGAPDGAAADATAAP